MAQTQTITNEGIGELVKLMCGEAATCVESICCLTDSTPYGLCRYCKGKEVHQQGEHRQYQDISGDG